jgi:HEXXH motif-containing protein
MIHQHHEVPDSRFAALASGFGGPEAIADLAGAQRSKRLLLLRAISQAAEDRTATEVLIQADRRDRHVVADLMSDPLVGAWAADAVRPPADPADLGQLSALAAAAAARTGFDVRLNTRTRARRITLPTLGTALLEADGMAVLTVKDGRVTVHGDSGTVSASDDDPRWQSLRRLRARHDDRRGTLAVEDGNPYRDCYHAPPADRLSDTDFARWQELYAEAWALLAGFAPERADEIAAGLRSVVPLATGDDAMARSGTARDAFGTMGLTCPGSATEFAVTLVHEFQHSKLSALLDLVPLYVPGGYKLHFAPWRTDARPTSGLIQGVYAFFGVADTWRSLLAAPGLAQQAAREFAIVRRQVQTGLTALEGSTELTPKGSEFAAGMRVALDALLAVPVPPAAARAADAALAERRRIWETHNGGALPSTAPAER